MADTIPADDELKNLLEEKKCKGPLWVTPTFKEEEWDTPTFPGFLDFRYVYYNYNDMLSAGTEVIIKKKKARIANAFKTLGQMVRSKDTADVGLFKGRIKWMDDRLFIPPGEPKEVAIIREDTNKEHRFNQDYIDIKIIKYLDQGIFDVENGNTDKCNEEFKRLYAKLPDTAKGVEVASSDNQNITQGNTGTPVAQGNTGTPVAQGNTGTTVAQGNTGTTVDISPGSGFKIGGITTYRNKSHKKSHKKSKSTRRK